MTPGSEFTLEQLNLLRAALLGAYSDFGQIRDLVRFRLGDRLVEIAANLDLASGASSVIDWAEQRGRLQDLVGALLQDRPLNPRVRELAAGLGLEEPAKAGLGGAVLSYADADDAEGEVTRFAGRVRREVEQQLGAGFDIVRDHGEVPLETPLFLIAILSPAYFRSEACGHDLQWFREREETLGRGDLIVPVVWIPAAELADEGHPAGSYLARRRAVNWDQFRFHEDYPVEARQQLTELAADLKAAVERKATGRPVVRRPAGQRWVNPADGLGYVWTPPGVLGMGAPEGDAEAAGHERPRHVVDITHGFWIAETPVTQAAWERVMGSKPSAYPGPDRPVEQVSWEEAAAYCAKVGGRLPTEAEWEYAARAGSLEPRYGTLDAIAWYGANSGGQTAQVRRKEPNAWGLCDTLGNVWEWVEDWYGPYARGRQKDPRGPAAGVFRALRGGSWYAPADQVRVSSRHFIVPGFRSNDVGFRSAGEFPEALR
jgi:formylglycine-generating enzyme required for sulfatase activity